MGIRDLCWLEEDLLILAGPTMDIAGPQAIYRAPVQVPDGLAGRHLADLGGTWKPLADLGEGLVVVEPVRVAVRPRDPEPVGGEEGEVLVDQPPVRMQMEMKPVALDLPLCQQIEPDLDRLRARTAPSLRRYLQCLSILPSAILRRHDRAPVDHRRR